MYIHIQAMVSGSHAQLIKSQEIVKNIQENYSYHAHLTIRILCHD